MQVAIYSDVSEGAIYTVQATIYTGMENLKQCNQEQAIQKNMSYDLWL